MISIVLYGRNDNYGYNLHKRAALSLNCMAELLTDPSDEILFVDYNTPDDFPTFPEAIQDTLTRRAKTILRILRVRPTIHDRFKSKTHLRALEPIARNIAIRRSSEANRWILSTNTDMIFFPLRGRSLSEIAEPLAAGFYHTPRIEIPEVLWESFNRNDPSTVIRTVGQWGASLHLNEIVLGSKLILYDGPGDFQLLLRSDLFEHHGFDERMLLGWHVDSNIAARMYLKYGKVGDLGEEVYGYHCDHTRQVTPAHSHLRLQNDWRRFVTDVVHSGIPEQADHWGCAADSIEELRLANRSTHDYVRALRQTIGERLAADKVVRYTGETYNQVDYDPQHLLPFLADMFMPMPRSFNVAWYGPREETLKLFASIWHSLGFRGTIFVDRGVPFASPQIVTVSEISESEILANADAFVFDFGGLSSAMMSAETGDLKRKFRQVARAERRRLLNGQVLRRIIALNAINNEHEWFVCGMIAAAATPFATHMRHGFILPQPTTPESWLTQLGVGEAGVRIGEEIRNVPGKRGWIAYGPYKYLDKGTYRLSLELSLFDTRMQDLQSNEASLFVEVRAGAELLALHLVRYGELKAEEHSFEFAVSQQVAEGSDGVESRIAVMSSAVIVVRALTVQRKSGSIETDVREPAALRLKDWLPFLRLGDLGRVSGGGVVAQTGPGSFVLYGPHWLLPEGKYELSVKFENERTQPATAQTIIADVLLNDRQCVAASFNLTALPFDVENGLSELRLPFAIAASGGQQVETRIWSSGAKQFAIRSVSVRAMEGNQHVNLLAYLLVGASGRHAGREIRNRDRRRGLVAYSPLFRLASGAYRLALSVAAQSNRDATEQACAVLIVKQGSNILEALTIDAASGISKQLELIFEVSSESQEPADVQVLLQVLTTADVIVRELTIEPALTASVQAAAPAVLRIKNWLPFLQAKPIAHPEEDCITVGEGDPGYAISGPYWTLPPGDYELIATIVPPASEGDGEPVITIDVSTEAGQRRFAEHHWHIGHYRLGFGTDAAELRLPFSLAADLPAELRTIETRIFTPGNGGFQVRSLAIKTKSPEADTDWLSYLAVDACGIHTGREIKSIPGTRGYIARSPIMHLEPGRYKLEADVIAADNGAQIGFVVCSGTEIIAVGLSGSDRTLEFDFTDKTIEDGIDIRLHATTAGVVSIRSLMVERIPDSTGPSDFPPVLQLDDWLPFLQLKPIAHAERDGIVVDEGQAGFAIYGPYWTVPPGSYELIVSVTSLAPDPARNPLITIDVTAEAGLRRFAEQQWRGSDSHSTAELRVPFNLAADPSPALRTIETRVFSSGEGSFLVRSLAVERVSDAPQTRSTESKKTILGSQRLYRKVADLAKLWLPKNLLSALLTIRSILRK